MNEKIQRLEQQLSRVDSDVNADPASRIKVLNDIAWIMFRPWIIFNEHSSWPMKLKAYQKKQFSFKTVELRSALEQVKRLSGLLPICASCKKNRDDKGYWNQIEAYISQHSEAQFSHGVCPECAKKLYSDIDLKRTNGSSNNS
jgi:hypothetical protein